MITQLPKLNFLNLNRNQLREIPEEISKLCDTLNILHLQENELASLPESIRSLVHLEKLYLIGNPMLEVEKAKIQRLLPYTEIFFKPCCFGFEI